MSFDTVSDAEREFISSGNSFFNFQFADYGQFRNVFRIVSIFGIFPGTDLRGERRGTKIAPGMNPQAGADQDSQRQASFGRKRSGGSL